jgi:lipid-A-disaccharide synthase
MMKRTFIVAGELSGDLLGAWYVDQLSECRLTLELHGIGGDRMQQAGVNLHMRFEELNVVGIVEIVRHLPRLLAMINNLARHLVQSGFQELVVVDFPGFNMRLIKLVKRMNPSIRVVYVSPPQLWCWGAWRVKNLKKYCDDVIVIYPFEVAWYAQRGVAARFVGSPVFGHLQPFMTDVPKKNHIALIPGSRHAEIMLMMPLLASVALPLAKKYPELTFVIPKASSLSEKFFNDHLQASGLAQLGEKIIIVGSDQEKYQALAQCCFAISKPGTVTLELALLRVPTIIAYKVSWLSYLLARLVVTVKFMGLPNLFLGEEIFPEFIQGNCKTEKILAQASKIYEAFLRQEPAYAGMRNKLEKIREMFRL